jgi:phage gpG-like protein
MFAVDVDLSDTLKGLDQIQRAGADLRPIWRLARRRIVDDVKSHFAEGQGPEAGWPYLAPSTIHRRLQARGMTYRRGRRKGTPTMKAIGRGGRLTEGRLLGRLKNAWEFEITPREFVMRSMVPWADVHQTGGIGRNGARIPARPFAWVSDRVIGLIAEAIRDYMAGVW